MKVSEIFYSICGESTFAGCPCVFVRLVGCNLRCSYCDTSYAWDGGEELSIGQIMSQVPKVGCRLVEITGGEPLLQEETFELSEKLLAEGYQVLIETNGSLPIHLLDERIVRIVDIKCPQSQMSDRMYWDNLKVLRPQDEVKFVLSNKRDYQWAKEVLREYSLPSKVTVLISVAYGRLSPKKVVEWMLKDHLEARFNPQLHKYIWKRTRRGV